MTGVDFVVDHHHPSPITTTDPLRTFHNLETGPRTPVSRLHAEQRDEPPPLTGIYKYELQTVNRTTTYSTVFKFIFFISHNNTNLKHQHGQ
jgi:hypothetical protein